MSRAVRDRLQRPPAQRVWWVWLIPLGVFIAVSLAFVPPINSLERLVGGAVGLIIIVLAARRADLAILALIIGLPFQNVVLAQLYEWGGASSEAIVRPLATWKEAMAIGVLVAGIRGFRAARRRADALDLLGIGFVAVVADYALLPGLFAPDAPGGSQARSLAFRATAGFVLLLLGARHAQLPERFMDRVARVALGVGVVVAAIAVFEFTLSSTWNDWMVNRVRYPFYQFEVLNVIPARLFDIRVYGTVGGREILRVGSVFLDPLNLGFYLVVPFALAIERTVRDGLRSYSGAALGIIGAALIFTQTRAALIGAVIVAFVAFRPAPGRDWSRRVQFTLVLMVGLIIAVPAAVATGLSERVTTTASGEDESSVDHIEAFRRGVGTIADEPLGLGLGTSAGVGQRFGAEKLVITENYYLQIGIELGVFGMAVFIALTLALLRKLKRAHLSVSDPGVAAIRGAALGLAAGALFLHTWTSIPVAWPFWVLAGVALNTAEVGMGVAARPDGERAPAL